MYARMQLATRAAAPRQRSVAAVPDVRAGFHGGDADGACGGVVLAGARAGGRERRPKCRGDKPGRVQPIACNGAR